ncbi:hypothetical protein [Methylobacterium nigriterrae]|uniref:hypothetical protein n=1 Tax=Methylobacterium nigriterrae TaxID=3127512 RepID=UPI003013BB39
MTNQLDNGPFALQAEWLEAAAVAARNLGIGETLHDLTPEHRQLVLANVEAKMRMRGVEPLAGWQKRCSRKFRVERIARCVKN